MIDWGGNMRNILFITIWFVLLLGCSTDSDTSLIGENERSSEMFVIYEQTIQEFAHAVENDDATALYELFDLNYENDVHWTVEQAQDLINYFVENPHELTFQIQYLKESVGRIEILNQLDVHHVTDEKRVPFSYKEPGLVFMQPDGKLAFKVFKHTLIVGDYSLGKYTELIIDYTNIDWEIKLTPSDIANKKYKNHNNEEVIDLIFVGPGHYDIKFTKQHNESEKYEETIQLTGDDMSVNIKNKNEKIIHLFF